MQEITIQQPFLLRIKVHIKDIPTVDRMMEGNNIKWETRETGFERFRYLLFRVTIKKAEVVRCLFKNIKVYD